MDIFEAFSNAGQKKLDEDIKGVWHQCCGPKIVILGTGGCGCNAINRLSRTGGIPGAELIAVNTDLQHLKTMEGKVTKVLIGKDITNGYGAGGSPEKGRIAAEKSKDELAKVLRNAHLLFLIAGEGGGTGTGSAPVIAKIARDEGAIVTSFVTFPLRTEIRRCKVARKGIEELRRVSNVVVVDNQKLVSYVPTKSLDDALAIADDVILKAVKGITGIIRRTGIINIDFADVEQIMKKDQMSMISVGEGNGPDRIKQAIEKTLNQPLLDVSYDGATGALIQITGGSDLSIDEVDRIGREMQRVLGDDADVSWGALIDSGLEDKIQIIAVITGISSPDIVSKKEAVADVRGIIGLDEEEARKESDYKTTLNRLLNEQKELADEIHSIMEGSKQSGGIDREASAGNKIIHPHNGIYPQAPQERLSPPDMRTLPIEGYRMPKITVVGVGGGGSNSVQRLYGMGVTSARLIATNTDANHLYSYVDGNIEKLLIGDGTTNGQGAGGRPEIGRQCALNSSQNISEVLEGTNLLFVTAGMGGGTGTGAAPVFARIAKERHNALVIGVVTFPFGAERSGKRGDDARAGISELIKYCDTVVVLDNQRLVDVFGNMPVDEAFKEADKIVTSAVGEISESVIKKAGLINIDFKDLSEVIGKGRVASIAVGSSSGRNKIEEVIDKVIKQPLLDINYDNSSAAIVHITSGPDTTLNEINNVVAGLKEKMAENPNIVIGHRVEKDWKQVLEAKTFWVMNQ
ncbi:MAG: hypothetical protein A7315_15375 [Candidatus Altiarchaeales archaeon WOR_SM1_79]|nr:MAG: hypothetical protein A7315_15375 [Candidatus Altiarchaeales archaeon WOR_SM1_79]